MGKGEKHGKWIIKECKSGGTLFIDTENHEKYHIIKGSEARSHEVMNPDKEYLIVHKSTDNITNIAYIGETVEIREGPVPMFKGFAWGRTDEGTEEKKD